MKCLQLRTNDIHRYRNLLRRFKTPSFNLFLRQQPTRYVCFTLRSGFIQFRRHFSITVPLLYTKVYLCGSNLGTCGQLNTALM